MKRISTKLISTGRRLCALLLCAAMLLSLTPVWNIEAAAASASATSAVNKLVSWGIMRGDSAGNLNPDRAITRAEFCALLNRAFGYTKAGAQPFRDVRTRDWFYDDISIAYTAGYFRGSSATAASPNSTLTREQAATLLCRNLLLQPLSGEDLSFTDSRQASSWSRGYIKAAVEKGILRGDPGGTFRPLDNITRGEVAIMLVRVIGTPVQTPGTYSNSVSGNLMVSTSGVTLENMTVTGDLYITGGVGLGYVTLNNVTVYGSIIASGAGESNEGDCSIILKNSTAPEMIVDSLTNQYVTIRSVGDTDIGRVYVRTDTYLENRSTGDYGFQYIEVDGEDGTQLDLSGNIHEVITMTPDSRITVGSGTVEQLTVDENAVGTEITIAQGATVEVLNLDTATTVRGEGDIGILNVNAPGCVVEMLPDIIHIRPGITADIDGIIMDSTLGEQMSDFPRILSGYPRLDDLAPNQAQATFQTNKPGTLYWAVRLSGDGPLSASDLINPPSYGANIVRSGNIAVSNANEDLSQRITGLSIDTSYVLSAVLVDGREDQSKVKNVYFTTPDNSRPAFASGYPRATTIEDTYVDFDVAPTKTCTLYWAIYLSGMDAPTANEFKDGSLSGAIDSGSRRVVRSEEDSIRMGSINESAKDALQELTEYDAYFFLTDGINDSNVIRVSVETADRTPPVFLTNYPRITEINNNSLTGDSAINEDGKVYWAIVRHGTDYPVENPGLSDEDAILLDKQLQIKGGMYALTSGSFNARENTPNSFNMNGLEPETAYDIYFVAEDDSGNMSEITVIENAKTLDNNAPTLVEQRFSQANADNIPLADTDITLVFSEDIFSTQTRMSLVEMYQQAMDGTTEFPVAGTDGEETVTWRQIIEGMFTLNNLDINSPDKKVQLNLGEYGLDNISVELNEEGQTEVTFDTEALNLQSGVTYQFVLNFITDSSSNNMGRDTQVESFRVLDAQVDFNQLDQVQIEADSKTVSVDATFSMIPYAGTTQNASENAYYDLIIAANTSIDFNLYRRERTIGVWEPITATGNGTFSISYVPQYEWAGVSYNQATGLDMNDYPQLSKIPLEGYEYAIEIKSINGEGNDQVWDADVNFKVFCVTGARPDLRNLVSGRITDESFNADVGPGLPLSSIGNPDPFEIEIRLTNQSAPQFLATYPRAEPGDSVTRISYQMDRDGTLYYVVGPAETFPPLPNPLPEEIVNIGVANESDGTEGGYNSLPAGERDQGIVSPSADMIMNPSDYYSTSDGFRYGNLPYRLGSGIPSFTVENLNPNTKYNIYFVLMGSYAYPSPVMCYSFNTGDVASPLLEAYALSADNAYYHVSSQSAATIDVDTYWALYMQGGNGYPKAYDEPLYPDDPSNDTTVLDAMVSGDFNDPGVVDHDRKMEFWELIQGGKIGYPTAQADSEPLTGVTTTGTDVRDFVDSSELVPNTPYVLIVGARNRQGGDPVFQAVTNIRVVDLEPPRVKSVTTSPVGTNSDVIPKTTVTIRFDKFLYYRDRYGNNPPQEYVARTGDAVTSGGNVKATVISSTRDSITISIPSGLFPVNSSIEIIPYYLHEGGINNILVSEGNAARESNVVIYRREIRNENGSDTGTYEFVLDDGTKSETNP